MAASTVYGLYNVKTVSSRLHGSYYLKINMEESHKFPRLSENMKTKTPLNILDEV